MSFAEDVKVEYVKDSGPRRKGEVRVLDPVSAAALYKSKIVKVVDAEPDPEPESVPEIETPDPAE